MQKVPCIASCRAVLHMSLSPLASVTTSLLDCTEQQHKSHTGEQYNQRTLASDLKPRASIYPSPVETKISTGGGGDESKVALIHAEVSEPHLVRNQVPRPLPRGICTSVQHSQSLPQF